MIMSNTRRSPIRKLLNRIRKTIMKSLNKVADDEESSTVVAVVTMDTDKILWIIAIVRLVAGPWRLPAYLVNKIDEAFHLLHRRW